MCLDQQADVVQQTASLDAVLAEITRRSVLADLGETDLTQDITALMNAGLESRLTTACLLGGAAYEATHLLQAIGQANLSLGGLVEGHVNADVLIALYGRVQQRERAISLGLLHGVSAADCDCPGMTVETLGGMAQLSGHKVFCSGLGLVQRCVVTAQAGNTPPQMLLIDATDPTRAHSADWQVSGMRATCSGRYDLRGLQGEYLGQPGNYLREPHFDGGIWRYLALHVDGLVALAEETRRRLGARAAHPLQATLLVELAIAAQGARLWVEAAAKSVTVSQMLRAGPLDVPRVLLVRQAVEAACQRGIALMERARGTAAFVRGDWIDLIRRDLAFFLRQADLDGNTRRAAQALVQSAMTSGEA
jgi:hypothetical protein